MTCSAAQIRGVEKQEGDEIYRSATPGAYAFIVCFILRFGAEQLFVISRTQRGSWWSSFRGRTVEAWVVRFIRALGLFDMGMPERHMSVCADRRGLKGKGPPSLQYDLTHFVDNSDQCGYAVVVEGSISHRNGFWIHFDTNVADPADLSYFTQGSKQNNELCLQYRRTA